MAADGEDEAAEAWKRLGRWLKVQRESKLMSRQNVSAAGGPSISTQQQLEDGGRMSRGAWVLPSPDVKTWARLSAAVGFPVEELRYEGAKAGLWEFDDFPLEAVEQQRASARDSATKPPAQVAQLDTAHLRLSALGGPLDELREKDPEYYRQLVELARLHLERRTR